MQPDRQYRRDRGRKPGDPRDAAEILRDADAAMYKAKVYRATTHFMSP